MTNTIYPKNSICDSFINNTPKVVILEDMELIREEIQQFIKNELGWQVIIAKNRDEAIKYCEFQEAEFYILDIKIGTDKDRSQEGLDTAEIIKRIDKNVFVSIFSGAPNLERFKRVADKIGVNYFEEKGNVVREGVSRIAIEMLLFEKNLLDNIFQNYLQYSINIDDNEVLKIVNKIKEVNKKLEDIKKIEKSYQSDSTKHPVSDNSTLDSKLLLIEKDENIREKNLLDNIFQNYLQYSINIDDNEVLKIVNKIKEVNKKLEDIKKIEKSYQSDSTKHPVSDNSTLDSKLLLIEKDENIREYESRKQDLEWQEKYQNQYVAFADGKWLEDFVADTLKDLLNQLRNSEHKGKSIFYKKVPKNNIVGTQESDKFIEEEKFYELPMSSYDFFLSEDEV